jgi:AhpD family alkylhydroperoxidase
MFGLEHSLLKLVKLRASQINGCAYRVDMHTKDARAAGESEQRLYGVSVLFRARAGGARLDRGADAGRREGRSGRPL